ncbi:MAG: hypothetical protein IKM33_01460 [Clostridia bacterium]|nr:hypothetical protein [Clostridia bacterium]
MKQVTYSIRGLVEEAMIPALKISCESLAGVRSVHVFSVDADTGRLELVLDGEPTEELESALHSIMNAKGLELVTPATVEVYGVTPAAPVAPAPITPQPAEVAPKKRRSVSLTAALSTVIVSVVLAVLLTFSLTTSYMKADTTPAPQPSQTQSELFDQMEIIDRLFRSATVLELDEEALMAGILKGYVAATGDVYAEYFTAEEYQSQIDTNNGQMCGIGVSVISGILNISGVDYQVITIANVYPDSPAEAAGVLPGDHIMYVGSGEDKILVHEVGYTQALTLLKGEEGTECAFTVFRSPAGSSADSSFEEVEITAIRRIFTTRSVTFRHYSEDESVGVIHITGFDNTTRDQFIEAVETLKGEGCTSFVLDLRGNPGGLLTSVEDVLVLFLREGDVIITTKDASGQETTTTVTCNKNGQVLCGTGELTREDVGKYRDLNISLLVNEYSASAAELFTSNIRDYELGTIVGTTTYGKGCGQTTYSLTRYGYGGALKLTTFYYSAPLGECYDGVGITPHVVVELSEEAASYNINLLPDHLDNQLAAAVDSMK